MAFYFAFRTCDDAGLVTEHHFPWALTLQAFRQTLPLCESVTDVQISGSWVPVERMAA